MAAGKGLRVLGGWHWRNGLEGTMRSIRLMGCGTAALAMAMALALHATALAGQEPAATLPRGLHPVTVVPGLAAPPGTPAAPGRPAALVPAADPDAVDGVTVAPAAQSEPGEPGEPVAAEPVQHEAIPALRTPESEVPALAAPAAEPPVDLPPHPELAPLTAMLDQLHGIRQAGGFVPVPAGRTLRPGDRDPAVAALARRLHQSGDLAALPAGPEAYDDVLVAAVRRFQARHGLEADGVVGPRSFAALNETAESLIGRLRVNLARLETARRVGPGRHVVVNLPAYTLTAYRDGAPVLQMPVVVGRPRRATPTMNDTITHLIVNPTWTVPGSILRQDVARHMATDPWSYLATHDLRVVEADGYAGMPIGPDSFDWQAVAAGAVRPILRMPPGPGNPLGRLRFHLTNGQAIYLHDTNERSLFARAGRAFSSGCVRVGDPTALAEFVAEGSPQIWRGWAADPEWRTRWLVLAEPVPVDLVYRTAWVDEAGTLQIRADIYGRDARELRRLPALVVATAE